MIYIYSNVYQKIQPNNSFFSMKTARMASILKHGKKHKEKPKSKAVLSILTAFVFLSFQPNGKETPADPSSYLDDIKSELKKEWPENRTINLVFHGHSVPAGYFKTPDVNTLDSYPYLLLKELKELYPYAVINVICTAIGGENSSQGATRFESDVLVHKPDVLFIDYALNDRGIGLEKSKEAWEEMINKALNEKLKVILLTPSPDQRVDILEPGNVLDQHAAQIKSLVENHGIGLADSHAAFKKRMKKGDSLSYYMSQVNHPNKKGHQLITDELIRFFK